MNGDKYTEINAYMWDKWAREGCPWSIGASEEECDRARRGDYSVYLTPCKTVPREWLGDVRNKKVLGLASGGGQQMPLLSLAGAQCTLFDYSQEQLARDRAIADREKYDIEIIRGDMTERLPFKDNSFDLIFHPVSNIYVKDVSHVWRECYRVLKHGGILLAGYDNGINFLFQSDRDPLIVVNKLPYDPTTFSQEEQQRLIATNDGFQFSHTIEEQIGGQLHAGFRILDLYEDRDREGDSDVRNYIPQYIASKAVKE